MLLNIQLMSVTLQQKVFKSEKTNLLTAKYYISRFSVDFKFFNSFIYKRNDRQLIDRAVTESGQPPKI